MNLPETVCPLVMVKHFGVNLAQAQRVAALTRLGITEQDVRIAERLMSSPPPGAADNVSVSTFPRLPASKESIVIVAHRAYRVTSAIYVAREMLAGQL